VGAVAAQVVNVVDGDTIDVAINGRTVRIRYIGIDTPETVDPSRPVQPFGKEASARNRELVAGKVVYLEKDVSETDRFGRLLRYVWLDADTMVNAVLVAEGLAQVSTFPPDVKYVDLFLDLQRKAREQGRGLWAGASGVATATPAQPVATAGFVPPSPTTAATHTPTPTSFIPPPRTPTPTTASRTNCSPSYPDVCIPPPPPDLDCGEIPYRNFRVLPPDPHRFDGDRDGIGCER